MAFQRPTLVELVDRVQQDFSSRLNLSGTILRRSMVHVLARVVAGAAHMLHGHLEFLSRQLFPDQADGEFLERHASVFGITRKPGQFATGFVVATGTNGTVIPAGAVLLRADGATYKSEAATTILLGEAGVPVTAVDAGASPNAKAGTELTFESPIAGANSVCSVGVAGLTGGSDAEPDDQLRIRLLGRMRAPPHGGSAADYVAWALEVPGVTRAWVFPRELGAGTVTIRFVRDEDVNPFPGASDVDAVRSYIEDRRPVTAAVTVVAPIAAPLNMTLQVTPNTSATRAAVAAELADFFRRAATPGGTVFRSQLVIAAGQAEGVSDVVVVSPSADVTHGTGRLATLGAITWA